MFRHGLEENLVSQQRAKWRSIGIKQEDEHLLCVMIATNLEVKTFLLLANDSKDKMERRT